MSAGRSNDRRSARTTTLLLVRHGATAWTHESRLQGRTDVGLSPAGRADVEALAPVVAAWRPVTVVASPLARAVTTAELLCGATGAPARVDIRIDPGWTEHGLGDWEGLTPGEIGDDYARWRAGEIVPPGGEEPGQRRRRVRGALAAAAALDGPVLVVTHGGTIRAALAETVGLAPARLEPVAAPSLTVVEASEAGARLARYNVTAR